MNQEGIWYSIGRAFYKFFGLLEWTYEHLTPNKILIVVGFVCLAWWLSWQHKFNKKAAQSGTYK